MKNTGWYITIFLCCVVPLYSNSAETPNSHTIDGQDSETKSITVFESGMDGYASFRIPAMVKLKTGQLIAFAEGRVEGAGDYGNVDLVYKMSVDSGKTWGGLQIAVDYDKLQAGNPAPVVDLLDPRYPDGRLFLFYNTGDNHENEVRKGNGLREVWYISSTDQGLSWTEPVNITTAVHRPNQPHRNPAYNFEEDWRTYANTPGQAMQFVSGDYAGRIFVAANHSSGDPQPNGRDYQAHGYYSDDHGSTFHLSPTIPLPGSNESMAAQISENGLYMNSRNQQGNVKQRIVSYSPNGGTSWTSSHYDPHLPDPVNQGSTTSILLDDGRFLLAFCNTADTLKRNNLTLRLSKDGGKTWFFNKLIASAPKDYPGSSYAAYSDLVFIRPNNIGVLYEFDGYRQIVFKRISVE